MLSEVVVNLIVTGIIALVPSEEDTNLTRLIAPYHHPAVHTSHSVAPVPAAPKKLADCRRQLDGCRQTAAAAAPDHFAYIEVHAKNYVAGDRKPDFRYRRRGDTGDDRLVFVVRSELIEFANAHTNTKRVREGKVPVNKLNPQPDELNSSEFILKMERVCPECKEIDNDYFDILANPDKSALRMDVHGGTQSVVNLKKDRVWSASGTNIKEEVLADEVQYQFQVPACGQRLKLSRRFPDAEAPEVAWIALVSNDGKPIDVRLGNAPLQSIIDPIADEYPDYHGDHFALFYDMYAPPPAKRPDWTIAYKGQVTTTKTPCLDPETRPQDPR